MATKGNEGKLKVYKPCAKLSSKAVWLRRAGRLSTDQLQPSHLIGNCESVARTTAKLLSSARPDHDKTDSNLQLDKSITRLFTSIRWRGVSTVAHAPCLTNDDYQQQD